MNVSHSFLHRPMKVRVASVILLVSLSATAVFLAASRQAGATTMKRWVYQPPSCMRRVTVNSNPCGATVWIDDSPVGQTPVTFPMPQGRFTMVVAAAGQQLYVQRILVQDAPLTINANLVPEK